MAAKLSKLSALQTAGLYSLREFAEAKRRIFAKITSNAPSTSRGADAVPTNANEDGIDDDYDEDAAASALEDYRQSVSGPADLSSILAEIRDEDENESGNPAAGEADSSQVPGFTSGPFEEHKEEASAFDRNSDNAIAATAPTAASLDGDLRSVAAHNRLQTSSRWPQSNTTSKPNGRSCSGGGVQAKKGKAASGKTWDLLPGGTVRLMVVVGNTTTPEGIEALEVDAVVALEPTLAVPAADATAEGGGGSSSSGSGEDLSVDIYDGHSVQWQAAIGEENDDGDEDCDTTTTMSGFGASLMHRFRSEPTKNKKRKIQRSSLLAKASKTDVLQQNRMFGHASGSNDAGADEEGGLDLLRIAARISVAPLLANESSCASSTVELLQAHARAHTACLRLAAEKGAESLAFPVQLCAEVGDGVHNSLTEGAGNGDDDHENAFNDNGGEGVVDNETKDEDSGRGRYGSKQRNQERPRAASSAAAAAATAASLSRAVLLENALRAIRRVVYDINMPKRVTQERDATKRDVDELAAQLARATLDKDLLDAQIASLQEALDGNSSSGSGHSASANAGFKSGINKSRPHHAKEWQWSGSSSSSYAEMSGAAAVATAPTVVAADAADDATLQHGRSALLSLPAFTPTAAARASQRASDAATKARLDAEKRAAAMVIAHEDAAHEAALASVRRTIQGTSTRGFDARSSVKAAPPTPSSQQQDSFDLDDVLNSGGSNDASHSPPVSSPPLPPPLLRASSYGSGMATSTSIDHSGSVSAPQVPPRSPLPPTVVSTNSAPDGSLKAPDESPASAQISPPASGETLTAAALLPQGWTSHYSDAKQATYYYNETTRETSWVLPTSAVEVAKPVESPSSSAASVETPVLPEGWISRYDDAKQATYYYNETTRETSWVLPTSATVISPVPITPQASSAESELSEFEAPSSTGDAQDFNRAPQGDDVYADCDL